MMRAVKVRVAEQVYHEFLKKVYHHSMLLRYLWLKSMLKHFVTHKNLLVSDPTDATRTGDVVRIADEGQVSRRIHHVITEIVAPWGPPVDERPAVLSQEQRQAEKEDKHQRKLERRKASRRSEQGNTIAAEEVKATTSRPVAMAATAS